jgi:hypothetical protein
MTSENEIMPIKITGFRNEQEEIIIYSEELQRALRPVGGTMKQARWRGSSGIYSCMSTSDLLAIPEVGAYLYALPLKHWIKILDANERLTITLTADCLAIECNGARAKFKMITEEKIDQHIFRNGKNKMARLNLPHSLSCNA